MFARLLRAASSRAIVTAAAALFFAAGSLPALAGGAHLYVFLGFGNQSPGLTEFAAKMEKHGIATSVGSYAEASDFAADAIKQYKRGHVSSIMIVGHSLGGGAARAMASELDDAGVPVKLLVAMDPVGGPDVPANVRHSVQIIHGDGEDHFSMIVKHESQLTGLVLGTRSGARTQGSSSAD